MKSIREYIYENIKANDYDDKEYSKTYPEFI